MWYGAGYHAGEPSFAIGLENAGVLVAAFESAAAEAASTCGSTNLFALASAKLKSGLEAVLQPIEALALQLAAEHGLKVCRVTAVGAIACVAIPARYFVHVLCAD